jgi:hypothetical protein
MKKKFKNTFCNLKNVFFLKKICCSFGFACQRWLLDLEKAFLKHLKSFKMEKNWERYVKLFSDRSMFSDKHIYHIVYLDLWAIGLRTGIGFRPNTLPEYQVFLTKKTQSTLMMSSS